MLKSLFFGKLVGMSFYYTYSHTNIETIFVYEFSQYSIVTTKNIEKLEWEWETRMEVRIYSIVTMLSQSEGEVS